MYRLISVRTHLLVPVTDEYHNSKIGHLFKLHLPLEGGAICLSNEVESFITTKIRLIRYVDTNDGEHFIVIATKNSVYEFRKEEI